MNHWFARVLRLMALLAIVPTASFAMSSSNYQISWDSINSGGEDRSTSTNYRLQDTIGETGTGFSTGVTYEIAAGYRIGTPVSATTTTSTTPVTPPSGGGGGSGDVVPPQIFDIVVSQITDSSVQINWKTNESANSIVEYGTTPAFSESVVLPILTVDHILPVAGLSPDTTYYFRIISTDAYGNTAVTPTLVFQTAMDATAPTNVSLMATPGDARVLLQWTDPIEPDAMGVRVIRNGSRIPSGPFDGILLYEGMGNAYLDQGLTNGHTYYYGAFAFDTSGNYSSGALASATPASGLVIPPIEEPIEPPILPPIEPLIEPPVIPPEEATTTTPIIPGEPTVGATIHAEFFGAGGTLPLSVDSDGRISVRGNASILVRVPISSMNGEPEKVILFVGDFVFSLQYDSRVSVYQGTFSVSPGSQSDVIVQGFFDDHRIAEQRFVLEGGARGRVMQLPSFGRSRIPVPDAVVTLFVEENGKWIAWNGAPYGQKNPQTTNNRGEYLFEIPSGSYYAEVKKEGYETRITRPVFASNIFNQEIDIIFIPLSMRGVMKSFSFLPSGPIIAAIIDLIGYELAVLRQIILSPEWRFVAERVLSPALLAIALVNAPAFSRALDLLAMLRYLFTQPLLLLWRRKRRKAGIVYDSLTKVPVDYAVVRLIDDVTGRIVQTGITDKHGRYLMHPPEGMYRLMVLKPDFVFPSIYLRGKKQDIEYHDLYFGGRFRVTDRTVSMPAIAIDPVPLGGIPKQILLKRLARSVQGKIAALAVFVALIGFVITPTLAMGLFAGVHVVIYAFFRGLAKPRHPKSRGIIYDAKTKRPIKQAWVQLFDAETKRLIDVQKTDHRGRYGFLVGKNYYSIRISAKGFSETVVEGLDSTRDPYGVLGKKIGMVRKNGK